MLWINLPKVISKEKSAAYSVYSYSKIASIKRALNLLYSNGTESKTARKLEIQAGNSQSNVTARPGTYFYSSLGSVASVIIRLGGIVMFYYIISCSLITA